MIGWKSGTRFQQAPRFDYEWWYWVEGRVEGFINQPGPDAEFYAWARAGVYTVEDKLGVYPTLEEAKTAVEVIVALRYLTNNHVVSSVGY